MKNTHLLRFLSLAPALAALVVLHRGGSDPGPGEASSVATLYARDDLLSTFSFRLGGAGGRVEDGEIRLEDAQIAFDLFQDDTLSFGFVDDELVDMIDLGDRVAAPWPRAQDRAPEFPVSLFHTLFLDGARFAYVGAGNRVQRLPEADRIRDPFPSPGVRHVAVRVGHTYLLRSRSSGDQAQDEYTKFEVIDHLPGHSLTIRWAPVPVR